VLPKNRIKFSVKRRNKIIKKKSIISKQIEGEISMREIQNGD
jgi:hypothetical protein